MKKVFIALTALIMCFILTGCENSEADIQPEYYLDIYNRNLASGSSYVSEKEFSGIENSEKFLYEDICFTSENRVPDGSYSFTAVSAACYDVDNAEIIYAKDIFNKVYPASTTKLLTALVAIKYASPDDIITISEDNCGINIAGAQLIGFKKGDTLTVKDCLNCLLLFSGNDAAVALAEHISGSVSEYCKLMNKEAAEIGAFDTHFTNPHGLHDLNHYTTAYDIYLIFNECLKYTALKDIFTCKAYTAHVTSSDGTLRDIELMPTNLYAHGKYTAPDGITVFGGKTGETIAAGNCLIIYSEDEAGHGYITELFKSKDRPTVYEEMNILLGMCVK